jgi:RNA polymerase sigma factor (sigma-70 family)
MSWTAGINSMLVSETQSGTPAIESDESLMRRLQQGDTAAGELLVERYFQPLMRYLMRLAGNQMADELLQQTLLSVLDNAAKFDPRASGGGFKPWLFRIATNKVNDHWRSRGRERSAKEGLQRIADDEMPPAGFRLEGTEQQLRLVKAIDQLPENQRQVLMLRYYSGMKFVEIAQLLGCPLNTALGRVHKAMIRLKELMK